MFWRFKKENKAKLEHKLYLARENPEPIFDVSECDLQTVPSGIYSLCRVFLKEHLNLSSNNLHGLSGGGQLSDLSILHTLTLNDNAFISLPDEIQLLSNLRELYIQNNQIKKLPSTLCKLQYLQVLNASNNLLRDLPLEFGNLTNLRKVFLKENKKLKILPKSIGKLQYMILIEIEVDGFVYPPESIVKNGASAIVKYICDDNDYEYIYHENIEDDNELEDEVELDYPDQVEAKIWKLEKIKEQKLQEFLAIERHNELMQRQELELANAQKVNKDRLLADIVDQQTKIDESLDRIQHVKDLERFKLIEQLKKVEDDADVAIRELLQMNSEPLAALLEQECAEQEKLLAAANKYQDNLCQSDILNAMKELLEQETMKFKRFDDARIETSKSILDHEMECDLHLSEVLQVQETKSRELTVKLQEDSDLQKAAVAALLEKSDARCWSLVQQVKLVESQLAALTLIEMDRHKLQVDQQLNDLSEKRINLSILLTTLLEQQSIRRSELLSTLHSLEENLDNTDDYWLRQYQQLLDRMPGGFSEFQRNVNPEFVECLLMAGVLNYLPFLAKWSHNEDKLLTLTDDELESVGIKHDEDRARILNALNSYRNKQDVYHKKAPTPSAPQLEEATAPAIETKHSYSTSECVVCMDYKCEIIYVPCGHYCCCVNCSAPITLCPMCRAPIERKLIVDKL